MTLHQLRMGVPGGLPAVLSHCFLGHSGGWKRFLAGLETPLDALAFDLPGHGRSGTWDGQGDLHRVATDGLASLVQQPSVLIGHSFGATLALRYALESPGQVRALVLIEPVFFAVARAEPEFAVAEAANAPLDAAMARGDWTEAAARFFAANGDTEGWQSLPQPARAQMIAQMPMLAAAAPALYHDNAGMAAPGRLEALRVPALLLAGQKSPPVFGAVVRALAQRLPQATAACVPGAGHMAPISHPQAVAALLDPWLESLDLKAEPRAI